MRRSCLEGAGRLVPERFSAGSYMSLCATYLGRLRAGRAVRRIEPQNGGWGATSTLDGASGLIATTTATRITIQSSFSRRIPLLIRRYDYNVKAGAGAGRYRGGFGLVREYEI